MANVKDPLVLYTESLDTMGIKISPESVLQGLGKKGKRVNLEIDGRKVVLPTKDILRENVWDDQIAFHPLSEDPTMGQSPVLHMLQKIVKHAVCRAVYTLAGQMLEIGHSKELQTTLNNQKAIKRLECIVACQKSTFTKWSGLWKNTIAKDIDGLAFKMFLSRDVEIDGKRYKRCASVEFPILNEINNPDSTIFGVKLSKDDRKTILDLFQYILNGLPKEKNSEPGVFVFGSNSIVPYYDATLQAAAAILKRADTIAKDFKKVTGYEPLDFSWTKELEQIDSYVGRIPRLQGNDGEGRAADDGKSSRREIACDVEIRKDEAKLPEKLDEERTVTASVELEDSYSVKSSTPVHQQETRKPDNSSGTGIMSLLGNPDYGRERDRRDYDRDRDRDRDYDRGRDRRYDSRDRDYDRRDRDYGRDRDRDRDYDRGYDRDRDYGRNERRGNGSSISDYIRV